MIQLKFENRTATNLGSVFGISDQKQNEIASALDKMVMSYTKTTKVYMADVLEIIIGFCQTNEEFIWAVTNHISWLVSNGRLTFGHKKHSISFTAEETGIKGRDGGNVYKKQLNVNGDESILFSLLCEAIHMNPVFKKLVQGALKFEEIHDHSNCPHCRAQN